MAVTFEASSSQEAVADANAKRLPRVFICCALINIVDGIDSQSIGIAAPLMARSTGIPLVDFGPVFSAALLGGAVGAAGFGLLADRFGRKWLLVGATLLIGVFTILTAYADDMTTLLALRFACGLGLGGVAPSLIALTSEFAPPHRRASVVTLMWASFPLGGLIGGILNSYVIAAYGWPEVFTLGGVLALGVALIAAAALPESPQYLAARSNRTAAKTSTSSASSAPKVGAGQALFGGGRAVTTIGLWAIFFVAFGLLVVVVLWTPSLLSLNGVTASSAALVVACNGIGAMIGFASSGSLIDRFGVRRVLAPALIAGGLAVAGLGYAASSVLLAAICVASTGFFVGIAAAGAIALAATVYPTEFRSTGAGSGMAVGRIGQLVGPPVIGALLAAGFTTGPTMAIIGSFALVAVSALLLIPRTAMPAAASR